MGLLNIFKSESKKKETKPQFTAADNVGTLFTTPQQANAYWTARTAGQKFEPFLLYEFENIMDAIKGIKGTDFIHVCDDNSLICTEAFVYGIYDNERGKSEVIIAGYDMSTNQWKQAKELLKKNGGRLLNEQEPSKQKNQSNSMVDLDTVIFQGNESNGPNTYEIYSGPNAKTAKEFLKNKPVDKSLYYIIVETP